MSKDNNEGQGSINLSDGLKKKLRKAKEKIKHTLPLDEEGKFTPNLRPVDASYNIFRDGGEYTQFFADFEDRIKSGKRSIYGMNDEERAEKTITLKDNMLVNGKGQKIENGDYFYNFTKDHSLIVEPRKGDWGWFPFNHSSITLDAAVICAGFLDIADGKITLIDTESGHYKPTELDLYNAVKILNEKKYFSENPTVKSRISNYNLKDFLSYMEKSSPGSISRLEEMRKARTEEHNTNKNTKKDQIEELPKKIIEIKSQEQSLADAVIQNQQLLGSLNSIHKFSANLFSEEFIQNYQKKHVNHEKLKYKDTNHKIQNVLVNLSDVLQELSFSKSPHADQAQQLLIDKYDKDLVRYNDKFSGDIIEKIANNLLKDNKPEYKEILSNLASRNKAVANRLASERFDLLLSSGWQISSIYDNCNDDNKRDIVSKLLKDDKPEYIRPLGVLAQKNKLVADYLISNKFDEIGDNFLLNIKIIEKIYNNCNNDNKAKVLKKLFERDDSEYINALCELSKDPEVANRLISERLDKFLEFSNILSIYTNCNEGNKEKIIDSLIKKNDALADSDLHSIKEAQFNSIGLKFYDLKTCTPEQKKSLVINIEGLQKFGLDKDETLKVCKIDSDVLKKVIDTSKDKASFLVNFKASSILGPATKHLTKSTSVDGLAGSFAEKLKMERSKSTTIKI
jgi:hypothetical protein